MATALHEVSLTIKFVAEPRGHRLALFSFTSAGDGTPFLLRFLTSMF
jgi:hypothetical protein